MLRRLMKEPLLHFMAISGLFFLAYDWMNPVADDAVIEVNAGRIQQLQNHFYRTWQRHPTADELNGLVNHFVLDEIYVREARALGLDQNDEIIRQRLRQKMEFLQGDAVVLSEPADDVLDAFLHEQAARFREPARYSFTQVFVNADGDASVVESTLAQQKARMAAGDAPQGDRSLLPRQFDRASSFDIDRVLGDGFAAQLDALPQGAWAGPVRSGLGLHFVFVQDRQAGRLPALSEIRDKVLAEWRYQRQQALMREHEAALRQRYRTQIDWPAGRHDE
jgi:hypothetical protein